MILHYFRYLNHQMMTNLFSFQKATMATKPIVSITPTFTLRRIDPKEVLNKYQAGHYAKEILPTEKLPLAIVTTNVQPTLGPSPDAEVYTLRLKNNVTQVIATSNHVAYSMYTAKGEELPKGGECGRCGRNYDTESLGVPVRMYEIGTETRYYMDDCNYCSFECVLKAIKFFYGCHQRYRDPLYMDAEQMLRHLYSQVYPDAGPLREAPDFRVHRRFKGSIDDEEFHSKKHTYIRMPNIILAPVKVQYFKVAA